jgi:hypothetical protein
MSFKKPKQDRVKLIQPGRMWYLYEIVLTVDLVCLQEMDPMDLLLILAVLVVLLLLFLYDSQGPFHYHSRFVFYIGSVSLTALTCIPLYCLNPLNVRNAM